MVEYHLRAGSRTKLFAQLMPSHIEVQIYRALLESAAAEHAARMTAMDAATRNSAEMIEQLTLLHEQGAPGGDHARDHRGRVRGAGVLVEIGYGFNAEQTRHQSNLWQ